jgi:hypothetical protein
MKITKHFLLTNALVILTFFPVAVFSQWYEYNPNSPFGFGLNDLFFLDTTFGWIAGDEGRLMTTSDGGITWSENYVGGVISDLLAVSFFDPDSGLVSTSEGVILKTSDGGLSWEVIKDAGNGPLPWLFYFSDVVYAGGYNRIIKGDPEGNEWMEVFDVSPYDFELTGMQFLDELTGYFSVFVAQGMGSQYGAIGKTTDGFVTYESITYEWDGFFRIYFLNESHGWCSGYWENNPAGIYRTYNGGGTWSMSSNEYVKRLFFDSMQTGWATDDHTIFGFRDNDWNIQFNSVYEFKDLCSEAGRVPVLSQPPLVV